MLNDVDLNELRASGISESTINKMLCKTISYEEAIKIGFCATLKDSNGNERQLISKDFIESCLYLPFLDMEGKLLSNDNCESTAVIKPRYSQTALKVFGKELPKYLCLSSGIQKRMYVHFPVYDWNSLSQRPQILITEGIKKGQAACDRGYATISLWSIWCFCENGTNSPLIRELKQFIEQYSPEIFIAFDSDKAWKDGVSKAELALVEKIFLETGKSAKVIDLPPLVASTPTKGLDDVLLQLTNKEFDELLDKARIPFSPMINAKKHFSIPKAPFKALPKLMNELVSDADQKFEGCPEMAVMSLFASVAVTMRNKICIENRRANLYMIGIADTVSGKSTVARAALKPLLTIDSQLLFDYQNDPGIENGVTEDLNIKNEGEDHCE